MGIFDAIMEKLGFGDESDNNASSNAVSEDEELNEDIVSEPYTGPLGEDADEGDEIYDPGSVEAANLMAQVDVEATLDTLADANSSELDWRSSIVDLMKLLDIDSSYAHRKELAGEVGIDDYEGTAEQNIQLHKVVLTKLADNGGNVPADLIA